MEEAPKKTYIELDENFVESYVTAAPVNLLNDGSIAIEFLKPQVVLVVNESGQVGYEGKFISVARIIMSQETAKRLIADLHKLITLYESQNQTATQVERDEGDVYEEDSP